MSTNDYNKCSLKVRGLKTATTIPATWKGHVPRVGSLLPQPSIQHDPLEYFLWCWED